MIGHNRRGVALWRRLAAILYDSLVLAGVWMVAAAPFVIVAGGPPGASDQPPWLSLVFRGYLLAAAFIYFGWFWVHGGQTLGMRAWRVRVETDGGGAIGWRRAAQRFFGALLSWGCLGAGFLWSLVDQDRRAWHDRLSGTRLVRVDGKRN